MKVLSGDNPGYLDATNSTAPFIGFRIQGKKSKESTIKVDHYSTAFGYVISGSLKATDPLYGTTHNLKTGQLFSLTPGQNSKLLISSAHASTVAVVIVRIGYRSVDTIINDTFTDTTRSNLGIFHNHFAPAISPIIKMHILDEGDTVGVSSNSIAVALNGKVTMNSSANDVILNPGDAVMPNDYLPLVSLSQGARILSFYPVSP